MQTYVGFLGNKNLKYYFVCNTVMVILMQSIIIKLNQQISFAIFSPFNLRELEFGVCGIADHHNGENDFRLDEERRQVPQEEAPALPQSAQPRTLRPFLELRYMTHEGQVFSMRQHTNIFSLH